MTTGDSGGATLKLSSSSTQVAPTPGGGRRDDVDGSMGSMIGGRR